MNIYFTASIVGKKYHLAKYEKILSLLKTHNVNVMSDHIMQTSELHIRTEDREKRLQFQKQLEGWINDCDCLIAETSFPSISVGFEISLALQRGKPVLILYAEGNPPSLLAHHRDEKLICDKYTPQTLPDSIDDFLNYVEGIHDQRFTFYLSSHHAAHLEEVSLTQKVPKSVYLRRLIEADMSKKQ